MHQGFSESPAATLEALYQEVYLNEMKGLPICNDEIKVEAIGFQLWEGQWLGILITPWFTNLLILRQEGQDWPEMKLAKGNDKHIAFPAGNIKFTPRFEPQLGKYLCCSLVSPMNECSSHQQAVVDAKQAMRQLVQIPIDIQFIDAGDDEKSLSSAQQARRSFLSGKRQVAL